MIQLPWDYANPIVWRLEREKHFPTWNTGEGAFQAGGRWSTTGRRVIYTSFEPSTTILEVAVHKGFDVLDTDPHRLLQIKVSGDPATIKVVQPADVPNPNWLRPGTVTSGQQAFGDTLLQAYGVVAFPSVVSSHSWNLVIDVATAASRLSLVSDERFALDTRLASLP